MDDLVQWLRAQLDEDERIARAATPGPWEQDEPERCDFLRSGDGYVVDCGGSRAPRENAQHVARHDPARVLREIDAKRQLLDEHKPDRPKGRPNMERHCLTCTTAQAWDETAREANCLTLQLLALPYEDRPGYREGWRP
ncbi:DUF6221 family protein [Streptomyces olivaceoviridis]|uniref:DUF6221 family protein n=1 Tax=Streptomyces olivaceoviridis TaxID=1921 RepID=UPI003701942F